MDGWGAGCWFDLSIPTIDGQSHWMPSVPILSHGHSWRNKFRQHQILSKNKCKTKVGQKDTRVHGPLSLPLRWNRSWTRFACCWGRKLATRCWFAWLTRFVHGQFLAIPSGVVKHGWHGHLNGKIIELDGWFSIAMFDYQRVNAHIIKWKTHWNISREVGKNSKDGFGSMPNCEVLITIEARKKSDSASDIH